jgi:hypothetical protein
VVEEGRGVEIDGVAAHGANVGDAGALQLVAEVLERGVAVALVVLLERLVEADGDGVEIAAGEAAVGGEALGHDEATASLLGEGGVA